jgi:hypothetical protein
MSVLCGNRKAHGTEKVRHETAAEARVCSEASYGGFKTREPAVASPADPQAARRRQQPLAQQGVDQQVYVEVGGTLYEGTFTVVFADGSHRTLRVERQADDASFKPGQLLVSYLSGSNNDHDYTTFGHVREGDGWNTRLYIWRKHQGSAEVIEAAKVLCMDPQAAASSYSIASGRCSAAGCNRTLTAPVEENPYRAYGLGPVCGERILG